MKIFIKNKLIYFIIILLIGAVFTPTISIANDELKYSKNMDDSNERIISSTNNDLVINYQKFGEIHEISYSFTDFSNWLR